MRNRQKEESRKKIVLGVCGSIAAYKSAFLLRNLQRAGFDVRVTMTAGATRFLAPLTMSSLSGHEVPISCFAEGGGAMPHIEWARWADLVVIAPATANCMSKVAHGQADDFLTTLCLSAKSPVVLVPALNKGMWQTAATQHNLLLLQQIGVPVWGPDYGIQACGDIGDGRMVEVSDVVGRLEDWFSVSLPEDCRVVVTAGPTYEPIDLIRFMGNYSSGRMGFALAASAACAGAADVSLIAGPCALPTPPGVRRTDVTTAQEMLAETLAVCPRSSLFISCAAVNDYQLAGAPVATKLKRSEEYMTLYLERTPDILATVRNRFPALFCVGFAAESEHLEENAREKLKTKGVNLMIANKIGYNQSYGMGKIENKVTVLGRDFWQDIPQMSKFALGHEIMRIIARHL